MLDAPSKIAFVIMVCVCLLIVVFTVLDCSVSADKPFGITVTPDQRIKSYMPIVTNRLVPTKTPHVISEDRTQECP